MISHRLFFEGLTQGRPVAIPAACRDYRVHPGRQEIGEGQARTDNPSILWWYPFHMAPDLAELLIAGKERAFVDYFIDQHTHLMDPGVAEERPKALVEELLAVFDANRV